MYVCVVLCTVRTYVHCTVLSIQNTHVRTFIHAYVLVYVVPSVIGEKCDCIICTSCLEGIQLVHTYLRMYCTYVHTCVFIRTYVYTYVCTYVHMCICGCSVCSCVGRGAVQVDSNCVPRAGPDRSCH